jgi:hypothetical protein
MDFMETLLESVAWIALGFVPTFLCLEMSWSMGKITGKRRRLTREILQQTTIRGLK